MEKPPPIDEQIARIFREFPWDDFVTERRLLMHGRGHAFPVSVRTVQENARHLLHSVAQGVAASESGHLRAENDAGWLRLRGVLHLEAYGWDEDDDAATAESSDLA